MERASEADPVKYFVMTLSREEEALEDALGRLEKEWGTIDYRGPAHRFDWTDYYEEEFGASLERRIVSFAPLGRPEGLPAAKRAAMRIESALSVAGRRRVNLDAGYLDARRIVLASSKDGRQKIYLGRGIWADPVAVYERGRFVGWPWSFADIRAGVYDADFARLRELYRHGLRA